jgi:transposase
MERLHVHYIREMIYRFRADQGIRAIARDLGLSRLTVRRYRAMAVTAGLLEADRPLPEEAELECLLGPPAKPPRKPSTVLPYREVVTGMIERGLQVSVIHARLCDDHGYKGSYSSVLRFVTSLAPKEAQAYVRVHSLPGGEAQVDFGSAGMLYDRDGKRRPAWVFVMTLSYSRHQYAELVFDQRIPTWLALPGHRVR